MSRRGWSGSDYGNFEAYGTPTVGVAARSMDHEAGVARFVVRALGRAGRGFASADSNGAGDRYDWRESVAGCGAVSDGGRAHARHAGPSRTFAGPPIECGHGCFGG